MITAKMEMEDDEEDSDEEGEEGDDVELDLRLARLEHLMDRRPELLSSVKLRQNPNDVNEWRKRVNLYTESRDKDGTVKREEQPLKCIQTFTTAVKTIDPQNADGNLAGLWIKFAQFYEQHGDEANARVIFEKATKVNFKRVEDLATLWCAWIEMELINQNYNKALQLCQTCTTEPPLKRKRENGPEPPQKKLFKSTRLWALYADLEETLGTFQSTKAVYERILELKIATPQLVINYATLLEERKYFEDSFKAYEKGINLFKFPYSKNLWTMYLDKFVTRYEGTKLERARDLFEQVLEHCPEGDSKGYYLMYASLEEAYGLARHAMHIYDRACKAIPTDQKFDVFKIYINKSTEFFGLAKCREIYEAAIACLPDAQASSMCLNFSEIELKLGEVDRARDILAHGSQFSDPRKEKSYWEKWHQFEVHHGNEDTFREMLRIKRSVQLQFTQIAFTGHDMAAAAAAADQVAEVEPSAMGGLEAQAQAEAEEVQEPQANPDEIDIDMDDDDDDNKAEAGEKDIEEIAQKEVPAAVFGVLADQASEKLGALERLKKRPRVE